MNVRAQQLGLQRHALRQPDRARRAGQLLDRARPRAARRCVLRAFDFFRRTVDARAGDAALRRPPAHAREPQPARAACRRINGVKTGHTQQAGYVLVGSGRKQRDHAGLGRARRRRAWPRATPTRWRCCAWALRRSTSASAPSRRGEVLARAPIRYRRGAELDLVAGDSVAALRRAQGPGAAPLRARRADRGRGPDPRAARRSGKVKICRGEKRIATLPLVAAADVPGGGRGGAHEGLVHAAR